jgi:branched-chain amino acid transport system substrate-binding protein
MRRFRRSCFLLLLPSLAACARDGNVVRIGVVVGGGSIMAARMALADVNADPRASRAHLRLEMAAFQQSSPTAPLEAIAAADSLAHDPRVLAVVGHGNSAASIAAAQIYNAGRVPQVAPTTTAPLYSSAGPYSFRMVPDDSRQGAFLAGVLAADRARRRVAVVYVNDDYGRALWKALDASLRGSGVRVVSLTPVLEGWDTTAMALAARSVADAHPGVVAWLARPVDLQTFRRTFAPLAPAAAFLASDAVDNALLYAPNNQPYRGVRFVRFVNPGAPDPALQAFRARFRSAAHAEITADAVLVYDAVRLLGEAVLSSARTREDVRRYLLSVGRERPPFRGLGGPVTIGADRNGIRPYLLARVDSDGVVRPAAP